MTPSSDVVLAMCRRLFPTYGVYIISIKRFNLVPPHRAGEMISFEQMLDDTWNFQVVSAGRPTINSGTARKIEQLAQALSGGEAA